MIEPKRLGEYLGWILKNVSADPTGTCLEITAAMLLAFPELKRVRGHFVAPDGEAWPHWWLVAPDGTIVDPTRSQFPWEENHYESWVEGTPEPTGKCPNCGGYCYEGKDLCSDKCEKEYVDYVNRGCPSPDLGGGDGEGE